MALYSSAIVMRGKFVSSQNYYCEAEGWPSFICILFYYIYILCLLLYAYMHFINEAFCHSGSPFVASTASP